MKQIRYLNRRVNINSNGYFYLHLPRQAAEALGSRIVDILVTDAGLLLMPKDDEKAENNRVIDRRT